MAYLLIGFPLLMAAITFTTPSNRYRPWLLPLGGAAHLGLGYKNDGIGAHWRGIFDDKGRIMVAISFNSDVGDSWEWADIPRYPEKYSALGIRIGVNYVIYAMTH